MKKTIAGLLSGLAIAGMLLPAPVMAGIGEELTIAQTHALLAYRSGGRGVGGAKTHLQHVINCLVGPGGEGFDPAQMNPCAEAGKGALPDAINATQREKIQTALTMAKAGLAIEEPEKMQSHTTDLADALLAAKEVQK